MALINKVISPIVGLTAEAIASRKDKAPSISRLPSSEHAQQQQQQQNQSDTQGPLYPLATASPPDYASDDEEQWDLDDAAATLNQHQELHSAADQIPKGNVAGPATIPHIINVFTTAHPVASGFPGRDLALPVILPQRRPRDKSRGFVRAYAPMLNDVGITEQAWLGFLDSFDEAIKLTPVFNVINIAAQTAGAVSMFLPSPTLMAVTTAIQVSEMVARRAYERNRTNSFVDQMNKDWFQPQGLYCLVMTYKPQSTSAVQPMDLSSTIAKRTNRNGAGSFKVRMRGLRKSDGVSKGEGQLPPAAPLVYPAIDHATAEELSWFKRKGKWMADYMDRRAQAEYNYENQGSKLGMEPDFKSKWGNPETFKKWEQSGQNLRGGSAGSNTQSRYAAHERTRGRGEEEYAHDSAYEDRSDARTGGLSDRYTERRGDRTDMVSGHPNGRRGAGFGRSSGGRGDGLLGNGPLGLIVGAVRLVNGKRMDTNKLGLQQQGGPGAVVSQVKKALRPDVLYLMVVPMPSEADMAAAREIIEIQEE